MSLDRKSAAPPAWAAPCEKKPVVVRAEAVPDMETFEAYAAPRIRPGEPIRFAMQVCAEPVSQMGKRGYIVAPRPGWSSWELFCDEGTAIGGADEAPSPLGYLISGVAFCLLTHITGYLQALKTPLSIRRIKVELRAHYLHVAPAPDEGGLGAGACERMECHVIVDSSEPDEVIAHLVASCEQACMAIQTVVRAVPTLTKLILNGEEREL